VISRAVANESFVSVDVGRDFKPFPRDQSSEGSSASSFLRELFAVANQLGARIFNRERAITGSGGEQFACAMSVGHWAVAWIAGPRNQVVPMNLPVPR
jgi:hypothetical protein